MKGKLYIVSPHKKLFFFGFVVFKVAVDLMQKYGVPLCARPAVMATFYNGGARGT